MSKIILYNRIKEAVGSLEGFHFFGLWNNQFTKEDSEDVVKYPAVYLEFLNIEWLGSLGNVKNLQEGDVLINLHVGFKRLDKDNESVLVDVDKLYVALHGLSDDEFDPLRRTRESQDIDYDNVEVWTITFNTRLRDCQATMTGTIVHLIEDLDARTTSSLKIDNDVVRSGSVKDLAEDN